MAQAFNLTAQLQLQSPKNVNQVVNDLRRQLKPIGIQVKLDNTRNLATANRDLQNFSKNARQSNKNMSELNRTLQESARRFSVITIATGSFLALANSFKKSVKEAVAFERELVRISQVTGKTVRELSSLSEEVTRLGTSLGASSSDLLSVGRTLAQAGFAAEETTAA
ncbi:MAG: phage tail tape measure protein, partial [Candidatus Heimdallarchaeaceae archaeon]